EPTLDEGSVQVPTGPSHALTLPQAVASGLGCTPGDTWDNQSLDDPPDARADHVAVWTGQEMIIWGGSDPTRRLNTGAIYNPSIDSWRPMTPLGAPAPNQNNGTPDQGFWTGSELIVWGGGARGGGLYDPVGDTWRPMSRSGAPNAPGVQAWMGSRLFVFDAPGHKAAAYDPTVDSWTTLATTGAPVDARVAIWTGRYIVTSSTVIGRYDPLADAWLPFSQAGAISGMPQFAAAIGPDVLFAGYNGYRYSPGTDTWSPAAATPYDILGGPAFNSRQVWTGRELLVWGGRGYTNSTYMG